jgi:hypothetical protein
MTLERAFQQLNSIFGPPVNDFAAMHFRGALSFAVAARYTPLNSTLNLLAGTG